tara:strand:+ start:239 stop:787 length:549 start_codon:yes stop_codon:yes gene_type:complete
VVQLFALKSQYGIETHSYQIQKQFQNFEIRRYGKALFSSVKLSTDNFKDASSEGFSVLAGYIFGNNDSNEKIAMTSPVVISSEDPMSMFFLVPKKIKIDKLPLPNNDNIEFQEQSVKTVAAISFGGWANAKKIEKYKTKLMAVLDKKGLAHNNQFFFLGYNAPYEVFNRKNEIIVELSNNAY